MTQDDLLSFCVPPFNSALVPEDEDTSTEAALEAIAGGLGELRARVVDSSVTREQIIRRLYQVTAALHLTMHEVREAGLTHRCDQADQFLSNILSRYNVGRISETDSVIHIIGGPVDSGDAAICGATLEFTVDDLSNLDPGPLCPPCCEEFTARMLDPTYDHRTTETANTCAKGGES